jgi:hypothetical protein
VRTALVVGLARTAIGGALRGALPNIGWLYAITIALLIRLVMKNDANCLQ